MDDSWPVPTNACITTLSLYFQSKVKWKLLRYFIYHYGFFLSSPVSFGGIQRKANYMAPGHLTLHEWSLSAIREKSLPRGPAYPEIFFLLNTHTDVHFIDMKAKGNFNFLLSIMVCEPLKL